MMQLHVFYPYCLYELSKYENCSDSYLLSISIDEIRDDGIYTIKCSKGHESKIILNNINFEVLFELGVNAIIDGYYPNAVSSVTASMERYFEFFIKVLWKMNGLSYDKIETNWKKMSNQSERQLGAYLSMYAQLFHCETPLLSNKMISFRNNVIHKGIIPTKDDTIEFADSVLRLIESSLIKLKCRYPQTVRIVYNHFLPQYENSEDKMVLRINELTIINVLNGREIEEDDRRRGDIRKQIEIIEMDRKQKKICPIRERRSNGNHAVK